MTDLPPNVYRLPQRRFDAIAGAVQAGAMLAALAQAGILEASGRAYRNEQS